MKVSVESHHSCSMLNVLKPRIHMQNSFGFLSECTCATEKQCVIKNGSIECIVDRWGFVFFLRLLQKVWLFALNGPSYAMLGERSFPGWKDMDWRAKLEWFMTVVRDNDRFPLWRELLYGKGLSMVVWTIHRNIEPTQYILNIYKWLYNTFRFYIYFSEESRPFYPKRLPISALI